MAADSLSEMADSGGATQDDAARDVLSAIKANDAKALSLALKRHYEACQGEEDYEVDEDDREA